MLAALLALPLLAGCSSPDDGGAEMDPTDAVETEPEAATEPADEYAQACADIAAADDSVDYIKLGLELEDAVMVQAITTECPEYEDVMMAQAETIDGLEELGDGS